VEDFSPEAETVHGYFVAMGLGSERRRGDRGVEDGAALRDFAFTTQPTLLSLGCTPNEAQARRGLELPLRGFIASSFTHRKIPIHLIYETSTGSTSASLILRALRVQAARLLEAFAL
jgi:hypothetical protein